MLQSCKLSSMVHSAFICVFLIAICNEIAVPVQSSKHDSDEKCQAKEDISEESCFSASMLEEHPIGDINKEASDTTIKPVDLNYECVHKTKSGDVKAPILLLHGMGASISNWDGTYETLAFKSGRRVCRADLRNHGDSPWDDETSIAAQTEDVIHLLDTIGEKTAVIIGHSLGGKVAMHAALNYPLRVRSIVLEDIPPNLDDENKQAVITGVRVLQGIMDKVPEGSSEEQASEIILSLFQEFMKQHNMTGSREELNEISIPWTCSGGKCRWKANYGAFLKTLETGFSSFWPESTGVYDAPALFIYGTESPFKVHEKEDDILKFFPNSKFVAIQGAGHLLHGWYPQFEDEVLRFLEETDPVS